MAGQGAIVAAGAITLPHGFAHVPDATLKSMGVEKIMTMTSTYDHRIIQGAQSGEYLRRIDELLQGKDSFYESVFSSLGLQTGPAPKVATSAMPSLVTPAPAGPR